MTPWEKKTYTSRKPADFYIREVFRKMQKINFLINSRFQRPFPKPRERLLSFHKYKEAKIRTERRKIPRWSSSSHVVSC